MEADNDVVWVMVPPSLVPERWLNRVRPFSALALLPHEAERFLETGMTTLTISPEEEEIARRVALGSSAREIAASLHLAERTVYRRLARLRKKVGARTTEELATLLARRGF